MRKGGDEGRPRSSSPPRSPPPLPHVVSPSSPHSVLAAANSECSGVSSCCPFFMSSWSLPSAEMQAVIGSLEGHLTATVHGDGEDFGGHEAVLAALRTKVGRLIANGVPTGVEVGCGSVSSLASCAAPRRFWRACPRRISV